MSTVAHQAYSTFSPDSYLQEADLPANERLVVDPVTNFLKFKKLTNPHGETIYFTSADGIAYLATNTFSNFFILIESLGVTPVPTDTKLRQRTNPEEFLWIFDTYGLEAALAEVALPSYLTADNFLVTQDLQVQYNLEETSPAQDYVTVLTRLRKNHGILSSTNLQVTKPVANILEKMQTNTQTTEDYARYTVADLAGNINGFLRYYTLLLEDGDFTYFYVPQFYFNSQNNNLVVTRNDMVKTNVATAEWVFNFLKLGTFDSVVKIFLEYQHLKVADKPLYSNFFIEEIGGKQREIHAPAPDLNEALKGAAKILSTGYETIVRGTNLDNTVMGFRPNKGIKENALIHQHNKYIIKMDIKSFFKKVRFEYYQRYLKFLINPNKLKGVSFLTELEDCFKDILVEPKTKGLYMGNPLSPALTNLMMRKVVSQLDNTIASINENAEYPIKYSIYADDITFSCNHYDGQNHFTIKFLTTLVEDIFATYKLDLCLNKDKTNRMKHNRRFVTGLRLNHENGLTVSRKKYEKIRSILHRLHVTQDPTAISMDLKSLQSRLSFYLYVDTSGKMKRLLQKYEDDLVKFNLNVGWRPTRKSTDPLIDFLNDMDQKEGN